MVLVKGMLAVRWSRNRFGIRHVLVSGTGSIIPFMAWQRNASLQCRFYCRTTAQSGLAVQLMGNSKRDALAWLGAAHRVGRAFWS
jgi:hypothetical protein